MPSSRLYSPIDILIRKSSTLKWPESGKTKFRNQKCDQAQCNKKITAVIYKFS